MKKLLKTFQEKVKVLATYLQDLADGASYAIHR